ncbi:MAG: UvrD-helicase domain-containing protein, partial [Muribaculaceae bacterium]|nr:UvrD-helicase domain-containing protein [Muribaculaceae bacterium]
MTLNEKQTRAMEATEGRVRVVAGAGSGKTRVLAHRFAFLVNEMGISPGNVLCLTFTNKAAQEMKHRIAGMVDRGNVNDLICT